MSTMVAIAIALLLVLILINVFPAITLWLPDLLLGGYM